MGVKFICPECRTQAMIIAGGYVREHTTRQGDTCTFTRTAGSGRPASGSDQQVKSTLQSVRVRATAIDKRGRAPEKCPSCGQVNQVRLDGTVRAHRTSTGSWCSAGDLPTEGQVRRAAERAERKALKEQQARTGSKRKGKKRAKSKRSVWTVGSGGLPGLGRRR